MGDNRDITETFHQNISSYYKVSLIDISTHEYAHNVTEFSILPLPV